MGLCVVQFSAVIVCVISNQQCIHKEMATYLFVIEQVPVNMKWHGYLQSPLHSVETNNVQIIFFHLKEHVSCLVLSVKSLFWSDKTKMWSDIPKKTKQNKQNWRKMNTNKHFVIIEKNNIYIYI